MYEIRRALPVLKKTKRMRDVFQHQGFLTDLKLKARLCPFNEFGDSMICDQIVFGTNYKKMKQKLLRCVALTLGNTGGCARLVSWQSSMRRPRHHTWSSLSRGEAVDAISVKEKHPVQIQGQLDPSRYNLKMDKCLGGTALLWIQEHGRELMQGEQIRSQKP
ncbi:unnamed protein product [Gadus morhua 'NCC']